MTLTRYRRSMSSGVVVSTLLGLGTGVPLTSEATSRFYRLTTSYAPSERYRAQGLNDFVVFGTQALASLAAGPAVMRLSTAGRATSRATVAP
ncbi:MAG: hypothetical protein CK533_13975 [Acidobacterium sp.]|nr:MAG: hypothetical protein CK533_13975 [Acidobacterium sp.]